MDWKDKFWSKIKKGADNECWEWQGATSVRGYGFIRINYKQHGAHRISYALTHKTSIVFNGCVLHTCDNPSCCNPNHLILGTQLQNIQDMVKKGRQRGGSADQHGENNNGAKLNMQKVNEIRELIEKGLTNKNIAARYGVTHSTISCIKRGTTWK